MQLSRFAGACATKGRGIMLRTAERHKARMLLSNNRGSATAVIGGVVGIIMMLYISVVLLSNVESSITQSSLSNTMNTSYTNIKTNTGTTMNLASMYPMVIIAGAMIAAFLGFAYGG